MKDKEFMASLNDTESDFEFVEKVKNELEKRGLGSQCKSFVEEIGKEQNPENFGAIAEKYLSKGKVESEKNIPAAYIGHLEEEDLPNTDITEEDVEQFGKDALKGLSGKKSWEDEVDEMADLQKSLDDYAAKNKKGREDIPATYKR